MILLPACTPSSPNLLADPRQGLFQPTRQSIPSPRPNQYRYELNAYSISLWPHLSPVLRLLSIVASECEYHFYRVLANILCVSVILAVRTWAIWEKTRTIFIMLSILSVVSILHQKWCLLQSNTPLKSAVAGASVVIAKDLRATKSAHD